MLNTTPKIESREVPTNTDIQVRGESRPFRTAFKTVKKFGVRYYGPTVMAIDLGIDAFEEDVEKDAAVN